MVGAWRPVSTYLTVNSGNTLRAASTDRPVASLDHAGPNSKLCCASSRCTLPDGYDVSNLGADSPGEGDDLAWSITIKLKGLSYETSWQTLADPGIKERLAAFRPSWGVATVGRGRVKTG